MGENKFKTPNEPISDREARAIFAIPAGLLLSLFGLMLAVGLKEQPLWAKGLEAFGPALVGLAVNRVLTITNKLRKK